MEIEMKSLLKLFLVLLIFAQVGVVSAKGAYNVTGVAADDYLNVREQPDVKSQIVTRIPFDGSGIRRLDGTNNVDGQLWWRIKWEGKQGWVNKRYLLLPQKKEPTTKNSDSKAALHCGGTEPFWGIKITKQALTFTPMGGEKLNLPIVFNKTSDNNTKIAAIYAKKQGEQVMAILQKVRSCSDGMSDIDYPYSISAVINNQQFYSGCCHVK